MKNAVCLKKIAENDPKLVTKKQLVVILFVKFCLSILFVISCQKNNTSFSLIFQKFRRLEL